jgi:hypothetical protein
MKKFDQNYIRKMIIVNSKKDIYGKSQNINYEITDHVEEIALEIYNYLKFLNKAKIVYPVTQEEAWCNHHTLRRIFNNGSFKQGGRFYANYQQMSPYFTIKDNKKETLRGCFRKDILINKSNVAEVDFEAIHPNLIYNRNKTNIEGKAYQKIEAPKKLTKSWMLTALNASCIEEAIGSFKKKYVENNSTLSYQEIKQDKEFNKLNKEGEDWANNIHRQFIEKHPIIAKYLCTGIGVILQYHDSEIMRKIMNYCRDINLIMLPVHDSCIVIQDEIDTISQIMIKCYKEYCREIFNTTIDINIKVDVKHG